MDNPDTVTTIEIVFADDVPEDKREECLALLTLLVHQAGGTLRLVPPPDEP